MKWMRYAVAEIGQKEISGPENNPRIVAYHAATSIGPSDDETPWCASFVNWCLAQADVAGTGSPAARSFMKWGKAITEPEWGCIVVFSRGSSSWQGHVGFYIGEDENSIRVLGGNQSNSVSESSYPKENLLGYRMPKRALDSKTIIAAATGSAGITATAVTEIAGSVTTIENAASPIPFNWKPYLIAGISLVVGGFVIYERFKKIKDDQI